MLGVLKKAYQRDFFHSRYIGCDLHNPPFDKIAQLYGAVGYRINKLNELAEVLPLAIKTEKPVVIDIQVDPTALYSFRRDSFQHRKNNT